MRGQVVVAPVASLAAVVLVAAGCAGGSATSGAQAAEGSASACELLEHDEVQEFTGADMRDGSEHEAAAGWGESSCFWADADPGAPGRIVSLVVGGASALGGPDTQAAGRVYAVEQLGEGAVAVLHPGGGVSVWFGSGDVRAELAYEVVPASFVDDGALDRLVGLATVVRGRLNVES